MTVASHLAPGLARMRRSCHPLGTHLEDRLDRRPTRYVDHLVDGQFRPLQEVQHRQQELALPLQAFCQLAPVPLAHNLVRCLRGGSFPLLNFQPNPNRFGGSEPPPFFNPARRPAGELQLPLGQPLHRLGAGTAREHPRKGWPPPRDLIRVLCENPVVRMAGKNSR